MTKTYPWFTPYQFASNDPVRNIDIDGLEGGSSIEEGVLRNELGKLEGTYNYTVNEISSWWNSWSILPSSPAPPAKPNPTQTQIQTKKAEEVQQTQTNTATNIVSSDRVTFYPLAGTKLIFIATNKTFPRTSVSTVRNVC